MDIDKSRLYVTTEKTYASGNLFGHWMDLSVYANKAGFLAAYRKLYEEESAPELKILDWQDIPRCFISRNDISGKIFRFIRMSSSLSSIQKQAFNVWLELRSGDVHRYKSSEFMALFISSYQGYFPTEQDFGEYYAKEFLAIRNPEFDYGKFTKQLFESRFIQAGGYVFEN